MAQQQADVSDQDPIQKTKGSSYRFPLFTESVRESLSLELTQSLGNQLAGNALTDLDGMPIASGDDELRIVGPFGVFRAFDDPADAQLPPESESEQETTTSSPRGVSPELGHADEDLEDHIVCDTLDGWQEESYHDQHTQPHGRAFANISGNGSSATFATDLALENWQETSRPNGHLPPLDPRLFSGILGELPPTNFSMDFSSDIDDWMLAAPFDDSTHLPPSFDNVNKPTMIMPQEASALGLFSADIHPDNRSQDTSRPTIVNTSETGDEMDPNRMIETIPRYVSLPMSPKGSSVLPMHSDKLLRYLKEEVLGNASSAFPSRISPWKELLLPCGLETYAEISLWNQSSHTRLSILCTLLSKSAYHLHKSNAHDSQLSSHWLGIAVKHQRDAQEHLKCALITEQKPGGSVKYTDILMAMLGVGFVMVSRQRTSLIYQASMRREHGSLMSF